MQQQSVILDIRDTGKGSNQLLTKLANQLAAGHKVRNITGKDEDEMMNK